MPQLRISTGLSLTAALLLLGACASPTALPTVEYLCTDRSVLHVTFVDEAATVLLPTGYVVELPQQRAASGFEYADERHKLQGKGNDITFNMTGGKTLHCSTSAG